MLSKWSRLDQKKKKKNTCKMFTRSTSQHYKFYCRSSSSSFWKQTHALGPNFKTTWFFFLVKSSGDPKILHMPKLSGWILEKCVLLCTRQTEYFYVVGPQLRRDVTVMSQWWWCWTRVHHTLKGWKSSWDFWKSRITQLSSSFGEMCLKWHDIKNIKHEEQ